MSGILEVSILVIPEREFIYSMFSLDMIAEQSFSYSTKKGSTVLFLQLHEPWCRNFLLYSGRKVDVLQTKKQKASNFEITMF